MFFVHIQWTRDQALRTYDGSSPLAWLNGQGETRSDTHKCSYCITHVSRPFYRFRHPTEGLFCSFSTWIFFWLSRPSALLFRVARVHSIGLPPPNLRQFPLRDRILTIHCVLQKQFFSERLTGLISNPKNEQVAVRPAWGFSEQRAAGICVLHVYLSTRASISVSWGMNGASRVTWSAAVLMNSV